MKTSHLPQLWSEEQPSGFGRQNNTLLAKSRRMLKAADEGQEENILPQLLGEENIQLSVSGDLRRVHFKDDGEKLLILETLATLAETVRQGNKTTRTELESNSRTVRCLEKSVSAELKENNRLLNEINLNLINLITYLRTNAREERRRREKEEEKQKEIEIEGCKEEQKRKDDERKRKAR